eukprot:TRINITY_DN198_c0_g2_i1.p1 TRINITY_DN198_c0_g2~~TRINITY_DN198_c0_g2_i1.p1  ORF type:complete len:129 (-),score=13.08 TRINITY_DN198_c0_g2_i1:30-416(-)
MSTSKKGKKYKGKSYGDHSYWDDRYSKDPEVFDWYQRYSGIKHLIEPNLPKTEKILMVGCGNSRLSEDMVQDGYGAKSIINIDISSVVIDSMKSRLPDLDWRVMDVTDLSELESGTFGGVVDLSLIHI